MMNVVEGAAELKPSGSGLLASPDLPRVMRAFRRWRCHVRIAFFETPLLALWASVMLARYALVRVPAGEHVRKPICSLPGFHCTRRSHGTRFIRLVIRGGCLRTRHACRMLCTACARFRFCATLATA